MRAPSSSTTQTRHTFTGRQRLAVAERRRLDPGALAGVEDRRALGDAHGRAVDGQLDDLLRRGDGQRSCRNPEDVEVQPSRTGRRSRPSGRARRSTRRASPARGRRASRARSRASRRRPAGAAPPPGARCRRGRGRTGRTTRRGRTRRSAARRRRGRRLVRTRARRPSRGSRRPSRAPSKESGRSSWSGRRNEPAAPPSSTAFAGSAPATLEQLAQRSSRAAARRGPAGSTFPETQKRRVPSSPRAVPAYAGPLAEDVEERLDVVHHRRLAEEPDLDRERRLVARLAAVALDRLEERRLLAADVRAGADPQLDREAVEATARDARRSRPASRAWASGYSART